jgi:TonB family protein
LLHLSIIYLLSRNKKNHVYLSSPIEVTFYSPSQQTPYQSTSEYNQTSPQISHQPISKDLADNDTETNVLQTNEEIVIKKDIAPKKKNNQKKIRKEKSKIQTKKPNTRFVKQIARNQTKKRNSLSNSSGNTGTFQSEGSLLSSAGGSPYGSVSVSFDAQEFKYPYYSKLIREKICKEWDRAGNRGKFSKIKALAYFVINKDGTIYDISIKDSSGNSEYDEGALDAIRRAAPFPEFPEDYMEDSVEVTFMFDLL